GSSRKRRPCICRRSRISIRRPAAPRASASRCWRTAAWCGSRRSREKCSMSDAGTAKPEKAEKQEKASKRREASVGTQVAVGKESRDKDYVPRFKKRYLDTVRPSLMKEFGYKNPLQVPKIEKIVINIGAGEGASDKKKVQAAVNDLTAIAGQKA